MLKSTGSGQLSYYIRSLKEIESVLIQTQTARDDELSRPGANGAPKLPVPWQEVVHMARIAPALLLCLSECKSLLEQTYQSLAPDRDATLDEGQCAYLEAMRNVLSSCVQTIEVANTGPLPPNQTLH